MACKCARRTDEYHGWACTVTDGECMFLHPNSKACAEIYGEGPDACDAPAQRPEPLTLEELRGMNGEMVWVPESEVWFGGSGIVDLENGNVAATDSGFWPLDEYGATWFAYDHPLES